MFWVAILLQYAFAVADALSHQHGGIIFTIMGWGCYFVIVRGMAIYRANVWHRAFRATLPSLVKQGARHD